MAKYLEPSQSFLSMTKRSMYIDKDNPEHVEDRLHIVPGKSDYLFVYPFVKTREWYSRTADQRQEMMDEHIRIGTKYRSVKLHTTYSFGLDDQEFGPGEGEFDQILERTGFPLMAQVRWRCRSKKVSPRVA